MMSPNGEQEAQTKVQAVNLRPFLLGIAVFVLLIVILSAGGTIWATRRLSDQPAVLALARTLAIPAARVNGTKIPYVKYIEDVRILKTFYSLQGDAAARFGS